MSNVQEQYKAVVVAANATQGFTGNGVGGFLCVTGGVITIQRLDLNSTYVTLVNALPVTAGVWHPIPLYVGHLGGQIVASGGASGTLGVC